jgi:hypothetical protein
MAWKFPWIFPKKKAKPVDLDALHKRVDAFTEKVLQNMENQIKKNKEVWNPKNPKGK